MSLHIIVAYDGPGASANPSVIYAGKSGDAARAAMDANTTAIRFERIQNPTVIRKHNVRHQAPVAPDPAPDPVPAPPEDTGRGRRR